MTGKRSTEREGIELTVDRAYHSSNYVGTYEIREFEGDRYIVSKENNTF